MQLEDTERIEIEKDEKLNSKFYCENCKVKNFTRKIYDLDKIKSIIFSLLLFASIFIAITLLIKNLLIREIRRIKKIKDADKIRAKDQNNFLGMVFPQLIRIQCLECKNTLFTEKYNGDFYIALILSLIIFTCLIIYLLQ